MVQTDSMFEDEVRRIARHLWPSAAYSGATKESGRERDGVFITDEMVHLIECTTSRQKDKAEKDTRKLASLSRQMRRQHPTKGAKGYFITRDEPTADQRDVVKKNSNDDVVCLSYSQFRTMMIDAPSYINSRMDYPFGSMFDPNTKSRTTPSDFITPNITTKTGEFLSIFDVASKLENGETFVLVGDYGAGKSTTMQAVFIELGKRYLNDRSRLFPVHLNLRDHHGQNNPAEVLERHARNVGFPSVHHLVRAWNAGYMILLLDGFDEFGTAGWSAHAKQLRNTRYSSMQLVREFVRNSSDKGVMVAGREHYFDNEKELTNALGLSQQFNRLDLHNFTDVQVRSYLNKKGWSQAIPAWLPSRPLLLGYLCSQGLLEQVMAVDSGLSPAMGWDELLQRTSMREAEIEASVDGYTVRRLIENLASKARNRSDGMGSLSQDEILQSFQNICGFMPDDRGVVLLQRLPGLEASSSEDGSRSFIDGDFVDTARAGDVFRFIEDPHSLQLESPANWQVTLSQLGREVAAFRCQSSQFNEGKLRTALQIAGNNNEHGMLCIDLVQIIKEMGFGYSGKPQTIRNALVNDALFGDSKVDFSKISFRDCLFRRLEIDIEADAPLLPHFFSCYVGILDGRVSQLDLPLGTFDKECVFDSFSSGSQNTAAILNLPISMGIKVLLTVLKKLYLQPGSGRKQSALLRGLDHRARALVPEILDLLVSNGLTIKSTGSEGPVWLPTRSESVRVNRLVSSPVESIDPIIQQANSIS